MWERRYGFPNPRRRATGVRSYSQGDVERLLLISRALRAGYRPGEVVGKQPNDLEQILSTSVGPRVDPVPQSPSVQATMDAIVRFDTAALSNEIRRALAMMGPKRFLVEVAEPLLLRVGDLWAEGQLGIRHERLLTSTLGAQVRLLLSTYEGTMRAPTLLLTSLPGDETHGIGPEMAALFLAIHAAQPRLFGDMPPDEIVAAARDLRVDVVGLLVGDTVSPTLASSQVRWIASTLPESTELWVGGRGAERIEASDPKLKIIQSWAQIEEHLERVRAASSLAGVPVDGAAAR